MAEKNGLEIFACWIALVQAGSLCDPRGDLSKYKIRDLSLLTMISEEKLFTSIQFLSQTLDWIEDINNLDRNVKHLDKNVFDTPVDSSMLCSSVVNPLSVNNKELPIGINTIDRPPIGDDLKLSPQYRIAWLLWRDILDQGTAMARPDLISWAADIEKIHRIDKKPWDLIKETMFAARKDDFWKTNLKSASKLRKHIGNGNFDKFIAKLSNIETDEEYLEILKKTYEREAADGGIQQVRPC